MEKATRGFPARRGETYSDRETEMYKLNLDRIMAWGL